MSPFEVQFTEDALEDLLNIHDYVATHDAPLKADQLLGKLQDAVRSLSRFPERGAATKELRDIGIREYREIYFKPYRIIYRINPGKVIIQLVVDGRRNMQVVLQQRLLRA
jgi:toxin ParE1/3/4